MPMWKSLALTGSVLVAGACGSMEVENITPVPRNTDAKHDVRSRDGGPKKDHVLHDSKAHDSKPKSVDAKRADSKIAHDSACVPKNTNLTCQTAKPVSAILDKGESLLIGGGWRIDLGDVTYGICPPEALVDIRDSCGNPIGKYALGEGIAQAIAIGGIKFNALAKNVAAGYTYVADWSELSLSPDCKTDAGIPKPNPAPSDWCPSASKLLNQGDSLKAGAIVIRLDDLMELQCSQKQFALLSVMDQKGNSLGKMKVGQGLSDISEMGGVWYKISVPTIGLGGTFAERWADVDVFSGQTTPCK